MRTHSSKLDNGDNFFIMEKTSVNCSLCQNKFATKFNLMRHIKSHHEITEVNLELILRKGMKQLSITGTK